MAADRGDRGIAITGYGGATSSDPVAQSDALSLGLSRAQALATALVAQGVPYAMLRLNAEVCGSRRESSSARIAAVSTLKGCP